jgi:hypothetical protein
MLTPKELYYEYTTSPCEMGVIDFVGRPEQNVGRGTPYDLPRLSNFLKQLKYPCFNKAPYTQIEPSDSDPFGILNTGSRKLALPFRFLQRIDVEAFSEIQPDIKSGTSHAIRNACDVMRACYVEASGTRSSWEHRGATEYLQYFGQNYITDCLMLLGPDLVPESDSMNRGTGCGDLDCLPKFDPKKEGSALGATFECKQNEKSGFRECTPCGACTSNPEDITPDQQDCCTSGSCAEKMNWCCGDITGTRYGYWEYTQLTTDTTNVTNEDFPLRHIGILKRKSYGGYVNLINNSGPNFYSCPGDILLKYFQTINNYDYKTNKYEKSKNVDYLGKPVETIDRVRTISIIQFTNTSNVLQSIKDLIYNGYGVILMTNVGFPNIRDSGGVSYPDRIWYHSYAIIGYDDRKVDYTECVYLLANSWGKWNDGGHPSWGPIPDGSFLVTESHLQCMLNLYRVDKVNCRRKTSVSNPNDPNNDPCVDDTACSPWGCATKQHAMGMVFALSMTEGFPKQDLDYTQFYKARENTYEPKLKLFFDGNT